jgi:1-acyl-sn-glycerol-3-phosphate acyltransferase
VLQLTARLLLWCTGWKVKGKPPDLPRYVLIAYPHTANWDGVLMICYMLRYNLPIRWLGKDSLFRGPFGALLRRLGGVPIDRSQHHDTVGQMVALLHRFDRAIVLVTPEATRRRVEYWKSGFYYIARDAHVPIALGYVDAPQRSIGVGGLLYPTGDIEHDMELIAAFYRPKVGIYPANQGPVRVTGGA